MAKTIFFGAALALAATPAAAQYNPVVAAIGQTTANLMNGPPAFGDKCYDGRTSPKPDDIAKAPARTDHAIQDYLALARSNGDVGHAFTGWKRDRRWSLDGQDVDLQSVRDPWASRIARVEPVGVMVGNSRMYLRAVWRAVATDGSTLGTYDARLLTSPGGFKLLELKLYSAAAAEKPLPLEPFCAFAGDIGKWREAKARREAEKATRVAGQK